jgi:hypothetical protein
MKRKKGQNNVSSVEYDDSTDESKDSDDGIYDDNDDDIMNLDDTSHLTSFFDSTLSTGTPAISAVTQVENDSSYTIRSAFGVSSHSTVASSSIFGDSIHSYVEAPSLFQPRGNLSPYYLSIDSTVNKSDSNGLGSEKFFVANINYVATSRELKEFFINFGYKVIRVDRPENHKKVNSHSFYALMYYFLIQPGRNGYAFVQLDSVDSVEKALQHFAETPETFIFKGRSLKLARCKPRQKSKMTVVEQLVASDPSNVFNVDIKNVHYGTFIMGAAMNKITGANSAHGYGLIAHQLVNNEGNIRSRLRIDTQKREISIIVSYESLSMFGSTIHLAFTWPFGA